jgi:rubrerythrin
LSDGARNESVSRLLDAWRGEVEAGAVYAELAARERDPRRADIIRRMAEAEGGHRRRIEGRLRELGVPIPDPTSVTLSPWQRMQIRVAPVERILRQREAAEDDEIAGRYGTPTGDAETDALLREIRADEQQHSRQIAAMRWDGSARGEAVSPVQTRLDRIIGRETWHRSGAGWISGAIYGANDGLAAVFGIVAGVSGATGGSHFVLTAGVAGAVASALSMATGAFLAERSEAEVAAANVAREREEIARHPAEEKEELSLYYQLKGLTAEEGDALAEALSRHPDAMLRVLATEEFGGAEAGANPVESALAGDRPGGAVLLDDRDAGDRRRGRDLADCPLSRRRREGALHAAILVGRRVGDDAGRRHRRCCHVLRGFAVPRRRVMR